MFAGTRDRQGIHCSSLVRGVMIAERSQRAADRYCAVPQMHHVQGERPDELPDQPACRRRPLRGLARLTIAPPGAVAPRPTGAAAPPCVRRRSAQPFAAAGPVKGRQCGGLGCDRHRHREDVERPADPGEPVTQDGAVVQRGRQIRRQVEEASGPVAQGPAHGGGCRVRAGGVRGVGTRAVREPGPGPGGSRGGSGRRSGRRGRAAPRAYLARRPGRPPGRRSGPRRGRWRAGARW